MKKLMPFIIPLAIIGGLAYVFKAIALPFVISGVLIYLLAPAVNYLSSPERRFPISRGLAVVCVYIMSLGLMAAIFFLVLPPLYTEFIRMVQQIPVELTRFKTNVLPHWMAHLEAWNQRFDLDMDLQHIMDETLTQAASALKHEIESIPHRLQNIAEGLMKTLSSFLVIFIVTAFVLIDLPEIQHQLKNMLPLAYRPQILELMTTLDKDLSGTIRGQLTICLINGVLTTLGLLILQVKFAVTIGFIAGIFSLIPVFGALISSVPAVLIALTQSLWTAAAVILMIIGVHLLEANILNPKILGHTVELHPAIIVFAVIAGEHFYGAIGLLFAVPVTAIIRSLLKFFYQHHSSKEAFHESNTTHGKITTENQ